MAPNPFDVSRPPLPASLLSPGEGPSGVSHPGVNCRRMFLPSREVSAISGCTGTFSSSKYPKHSRGSRPAVQGSPHEPPLFKIWDAFPQTHLLRGGTSSTSGWCLGTSHGGTSSTFGQRLHIRVGPSTLGGGVNFSTSGWLWHTWTALAPHLGGPLPHLDEAQTPLWCHSIALGTHLSPLGGAAVVTPNG